jgi:hypothetical protein
MIPSCLLISTRIVDSRDIVTNMPLEYYREQALFLRALLVLPRVHQHPLELTCLLIVLLDILKNVSRQQSPSPACVQAFCGETVCITAYGILVVMHDIGVHQYNQPTPCAAAESTSAYGLLLGFLCLRQHTLSTEG